MLCNHLFHIATDPSETHDVCKEEPAIYNQLKDRLLLFGAAAEIELNTGGKPDPRALEIAKKTGYWTPWLGGQLEKPSSKNTTDVYVVLLVVVLSVLLAAICILKLLAVKAKKRGLANSVKPRVFASVGLLVV